MPEVIHLNDKLAWCKHGDAQELEFVEEYGDRIGLTINPGKAKTDKGKYLPDLFSYKYSRVADLKRVTTPFFKAQQYNSPPSLTVTMNIKDLFRYGANYPDIIVYFWVTWESQENYGVKVDSIDGIWAAGLKTLYSLKPNIHEYKGRTQDTQGNAKCSLVINLSNLKRVI